MAGKENGDARKAIDLLRVAAEIAEKASDVQEMHIRQAQEKIEKDTNYEVLKFYYSYQNNTISNYEI